ncbi:MAG: ABC transporter permease [Flavobacteriales bacterium]|nr:ABC transporter permease [Flavobacteriales bacterium]
MRALPHIIRKEFTQISRNKVMIPLLFFMPIVQLVVLSYAADFEVKNLNLAIVDYDQSESSRHLIQKFTASGYFTLVGSFRNVKDGTNVIEKEVADLVLICPQHMERNLENMRVAEVQLLFNAVNNQKAGVASSYCQQVISAFNNEHLRQLAMESTTSTPARLTVDVRESFWYNAQLDYKTFMVPGILAILVTMLTAFLSSINIIREKEMGTIEQLNVTPISKMEFILGKIIPFWIIGMVVMSFGLVIAWLMFGIGVTGNILTLFSFVAIYLIAILGIGILISTVTETQQQAMFVTWFFMVIFLLLSGLFTPVDSIPEWARALNLVNPIKYFVEVMRSIMLKGSSLSDLNSHFLVMTVFALGFNLMAMRSYRKTMG